MTAREMNEIQRTEEAIFAALRESGKWMTQRQIRKATGLPMSRVENFTLSLALEDRIGRTLTPDHRTQLFRSARVFTRCRFGDRISQCYHNPRCSNEAEGFGRYTAKEN